jgi:predicted DNA binding CopG/RHH family protein
MNKEMVKEPKIGQYIDDEEKDLVEALESDTTLFKSILTPEKRKEVERMASKIANDEHEKISLRIPRNDFVRIKSKALQEGIPYQIFINSILHKAVSS